MADLSALFPSLRFTSALAPTTPTSLQDFGPGSPFGAIPPPGFVTTATPQYGAVPSIFTSAFANLFGNGNGSATQAPNAIDASGNLVNDSGGNLGVSVIPATATNPLPSLQYGSNALNANNLYAAGGGGFLSGLSASPNVSPSGGYSGSGIGGALNISNLSGNTSLPSGNLSSPVTTDLLTNAGGGGTPATCTVASIIAGTSNCWATPNNPNATPGNFAGQVGSGLAAKVPALGAIGTFFSDLTALSTWERVGMVFIGLVILAAAIFLLGHAQIQELRNV